MSEAMRTEKGNEVKTGQVQEADVTKRPGAIKRILRKAAPIIGGLMILKAAAVTQGCGNDEGTQADGATDGQVADVYQPQDAGVDARLDVRPDVLADAVQDVADQTVDSPLADAAPDVVTPDTAPTPDSGPSCGNLAAIAELKAGSSAGSSLVGMKVYLSNGTATVNASCTYAHAVKLGCQMPVEDGQTVSLNEYIYGSTGKATVTSSDVSVPVQVLYKGGFANATAVITKSSCNVKDSSSNTLGSCKFYFAVDPVLVAVSYDDPNATGVGATTLTRGTETLDMLAKDGVTETVLHGLSSLKKTVVRTLKVLNMNGMQFLEATVYDGSSPYQALVALKDGASATLGPETLKALASTDYHDSKTGCYTKGATATFKHNGSTDTLESGKTTGAGRYTVYAVVKTDYSGSVDKNKSFMVVVDSLATNKTFVVKYGQTRTVGSDTWECVGLAAPQKNVPDGGVPTPDLGTKTPDLGTPDQKVPDAGVKDAGSG